MSATKAGTCESRRFTLTTSPPEYHRQWRARHPGYTAAAAKKVRAKWTPEKRQEALEYRREWNARLRADVRGAYGDACACCGEDEPKFLSVDHIDGTGAEHRRGLGIDSGFHFHLWLRREGFPPGFQILCFNCNQAKSHGGCPHKEG